MGPTAVQRLLRKLCDDRKLTPRAASLKAGLDQNVVGNLIRGRHLPTAATIEKLISGLELGQDEALQLRSLPTFHRKEAASSAGIRVVQEHWPALTYIYARDIHVPLMGTGIAPDPDQATLQLFEQAVTQGFTRFTAGMKDSAPPPRLVELLLGRFAEVDPVTLDSLHLVSETTMDGGPERKHERPTHLLEERAKLLAAGATTPLHPERAASRALRWGLDRGFCAAVFPKLFWHSCKHFHFAWIHNQLGRLTETGLKRLYRHIRGGLSFRDFEDTILGRGRLGSSLISREIRRAHADVRPWQASSEHVCFHQGVAYSYTGPEPATDLLFDHFDRECFLWQFPIFRVDHSVGNHVARVAAASSVYFATWLAEIMNHSRDFDSSVPPFSGGPCLQPVDEDEVDWARPGDVGMRRELSWVGVGLQILISTEDWRVVARLIEELPVNWRPGVLQSLAAWHTASNRRRRSASQ